MAGSRTARLLFQLMTAVFLSLLLNVCSVESRRGNGSKHEKRYNGLERGKDPLPWWVITLIFVGGVLSVFLCVMGLRKIYEKKRQQKIRSMLSRRSTNLQRRRSSQMNTAATGGTQQGDMVAPPSYEQSAKDDAHPPAYTYSKDVNTQDEFATSPPAVATEDATAVPMEGAFPAAPPSYDVAQRDGGEVVEMGGNGSMGMNSSGSGETPSGETNVEV